MVINFKGWIYRCKNVECKKQYLQFKYQKPQAWTIILQFKYQTSQEWTIINHMVMWGNETQQKEKKHVDRWIHISKKESSDKNSDKVPR